MRIIFVGLHNKPGMKPLDSRTKSGKLIDRIIDQLKEHKVVKTNLYDTEYLPNDKERAAIKFYWHDVYDPSHDDIIVLLGRMTHDEFDEQLPCKIIKVAHPASKRSHKGMDDYVENTLGLILKAINKTKHNGLLQ